MSGSKAALKAINEAIRSQKFDDAIEKAQDFLKRETKNYQGCVSLSNHAAGLLLYR